MLSFFGVIWNSFLVPRPAPPYDEAWAKDDKWYRTFTTKAGADYSAVLSLAKEKYKELVDLHDAIDEKAEWMFGIALGGMAGVLAAVIPWKLPLYSIIPAVVAFLATILATIRCRMPDKRPSPMTTQGMMSVMENEPDNFNGRLTASFHCATEGMKRVNDWKSLQVCSAVNSLMLGVCLLIVPLAFRDSQRPPAPASSHCESCRLMQVAHTEPKREWKWEWGRDHSPNPTAPDHPTQTD